MNLQTLADQLGISRSTVSRALRSDERISLTTRRRVSELAGKLGYKQNPYLSVLMHTLREGTVPAVTPVIAFINPAPSRELWHKKKTNRLIFQGLGKRARELGFALEEFWLGQKDMTGKRLVDILRARNVRAAVLGGEAPEISKRFTTEGFAAVDLGFGSSSRCLHRVSPDYLGNTMLAIRCLRDKGYRRIGLALEESEGKRMRMMPRMAFLDYEHTLAEGDRAGMWIGSSEDLSGFARWVLKNQPDAIVTADWLPQKWLQPLGFRIPEDIGVAQLEPLFFPFNHSGIDGRFELIGSAAVDLVVAQIHANEFSPPSVPNLLLASGEWREGWSTRDVTRGGNPRPLPVAQRTVLSLASHRPSEALATARAELASSQEASRFALAASATRNQWYSIDIGSMANAPFQAPAWRPHFSRPRRLPDFCGERFVHGIPFRRPDNPSPERRSAILIQSYSQTGTKVASISIDKEITAKSVYFFHLSFYGWNGYPLSGEYRFCYENGDVESRELRVYSPQCGNSLIATHQDSWAAYPQFESDCCKPFIILSPDRPFEEDRYGYVLEYQCRRGAGRLESIQLLSEPNSDAAILVAAITLLKNAPEV